LTQIKRDLLDGNSMGWHPGGCRPEDQGLVAMNAPRSASSGGGDYFEHDADMGVVGRGATLEEAFESAAAATFAIMADLAAVRPEQSVTLDFEEADVEIALVRWLNLLLGISHEKGLVFGRFWIERDGVKWRGGASGEPWRRDLERGTEVKGATLTMLEVKQESDGWRARCVVDV
jgi:SHS2 domain-containing protein